MSVNHRDRGREQYRTRRSLTPCSTRSRVIARIVAAIGAVIVHVCKLRWHLGKLVLSDGSGIKICYRIWYGLGMEAISVVLISLDHAEQGIKCMPGVWKLEVWVDSARVSLHEKKVGIVGKRIRALL